jgi:hypothetical protein
LPCARTHEQRATPHKTKIIVAINSIDWKHRSANIPQIHCLLRYALFHRGWPGTILTPPTPRLLCPPSPPEILRLFAVS